jgi:hypothetical protein
MRRAAQVRGLIVKSELKAHLRLRVEIVFAIKIDSPHPGEFSLKVERHEGPSERPSNL